MAHVVRQMIQAEGVHQLQVVQTVGHGERLVGRHARPVHEFGTVERQQADQRDAVAQVGQFAHFGETRNVLTLSNNNNNNTSAVGLSPNIDICRPTAHPFRPKKKFNSNSFACAVEGNTLISQNFKFPGATTS